MFFKDIKARDLYCIFVVIFASVVTFSESLNSLSLYIFIPSAFVLCYLKNRRLFSSKEIKTIIILFTWLAFTSLLTENMDATSRQLRQVLGVALMCYIISVTADTKQNIKYLYIAFITLFISAIIYAYQNIYLVIDLTTQRLNDQHLNANTLAYYTFFATFVIYYLDDFVYSKSMHIVLRMLYIAMAAIIFNIALLTASRQIIMLILPFWAILLFVRYFNINQRNIFIGALLGVVMLVGYQYFFDSAYGDSVLAQRSEVSAQDDVRYELLISAIDVGINNPIVGVGPGCYMFHSPEQNFSHNSFAELFANCGIVAPLILLILFYQTTMTQWKRYVLTKDKIFLCGFVFFVTYVLYNFFYVFYLDIWLLSFYVLVASHLSTYYNTTYEH